MFRIVIEARPNAEVGEASNIAGAYAVCWINLTEQEKAEQVAVERLEQIGWLLMRINEVEWLRHDEIVNDEEALFYYAEAEKDGSALVLYTWSSDAEDADVDYD